MIKPEEWILVTGGLGFIGSNVCVELLKRDCNILVIDDLSTGSYENLEKLQTYGNLEFVKGCISNYDLLISIFERYSIPLVIHLAGVKSVEESIMYPDKYKLINVDFSKVLLKACRYSNVRSFVFSSSATVYSPSNPMPVNETAALSPCNPYGQSKLAVEKLIREQSTLDPTFNSMILRYFNPLGCHEGREFGEPVFESSRNLMPQLINAASSKNKSKKVFKIFGHDYDTLDGTAVRDFVHVSCIAEAHVAAVSHLYNEAGCIECINLGTGLGASVKQVVTQFMEISQVNLDLRFESPRNGDVGVVFGDCGKAFNLLGWRAKRDLRQMITDSINFSLKGGNENSR